MLTGALQNTGVGTLLGCCSRCCQSGSGIRVSWGSCSNSHGSLRVWATSWTDGHPLGSLGLTCAECIVCWLLSCHLEAISIEMVTAACCVLSVARGTAQHSPGSGSQEPFASCRISSLKPSEALPSRPSSGPLLSLPFPPLLDLKSNGTCRGQGWGEILISILMSFLAHIVG